MTRRPNTWGSIYQCWLRRGVDHAYAAWMADRWKKSKQRLVVDREPKRV